MEINEYYSVRKKIKSGDLLIWSKGTGRGLNSAILFLIKLFTLSQYIHVGIAWKSSGRIFVIEATLNGVLITPLSKKKGFYLIPMKLKWMRNYDSFLLNKIGEQYSIVDAIRGYLKMDLDSSDSKWQCVELASTFYEHVGIELPKYILTPSRLVEALLDIGYSIIYVNGRRR